MRKETQGKLSRRTLFMGAGAVGAIATVASTLPGGQQAEQASQEPRPAPANGGGYHLSEHVKRYYKTTLI